MELDWLIIGLGNPGKQYRGSLHNAGFDVLDLLLQDYQADPAFPSPPVWQGVRVSSKMHYSLLCKPPAALQSSTSPNCKALLVKPQTYMNLSGRVLSLLRKRYSFVPERCIVLLDNLDLEPGRLRLKFGGGVSSHNGLRSLREGGLQANFWRLFIGIGHPGRDRRQHEERGEHTRQLSKYVLGKPRKADEELYHSSLKRARQALQQILRGARAEELATQINRRIPG